MKQAGPSDRALPWSGGGRGFADFCGKRAARAETLSERAPECAEALRFYAATSRLQARAGLDLETLVAIVAESGTDPLREAGRALSQAGAYACAWNAYRSGADRTSPTSYYVRVLLQQQLGFGASLASFGSATAPERGICPRCGYPPQVGRLVPEGHGLASHLSCSICFGSWPSSRTSCPRCGESASDKLPTFASTEKQAVEVAACDGCQTYLIWVREDRAPDAIPEADEISALPLDTWARARGYRKWTPNLVGM